MINLVLNQNLVSNQKPRFCISNSISQINGELEYCDIMELIHVKPMLYDQKWMYDVEVRNVARGLINEKSEKLIVPDDENVISS